MLNVTYASRIFKARIGTPGSGEGGPRWVCSRASLALGQFNDRPISAEQKVSEHLAGVAIFRLDVAYEPGYRPSEGEEMLARFGEISAERRGEVSR